NRRRDEREGSSAASHDSQSLAFKLKLRSTGTGTAPRGGKRSSGSAPRRGQALLPPGQSTQARPLMPTGLAVGVAGDLDQLEVGVQADVHGGAVGARDLNIPA